jgi:flagellar biosynthesis protein FlhB
MAEDKPHEATPTKIRKARNEGNVAKTAELNGAFSFMAAAYIAFALVPSLAGLFMDWIRDAAMGRPITPRYILQIAMYLAVIMLSAGLAGAFINFLQTQGFVTTTPKFDPKRLNPVPGIKRMFGMEGVINAVRGFISSMLALMALKSIVTDVFSSALINTSPLALSILTQSAFSRIVGTLFGIGLMFGALDFFVVLQRWKKGLRMTHDEVKRDFKENNGDPQIKGKRKQLHRQFLRGSPARAADATMVVTNPTHFAVALEYRPPQIPVPRVLCRAADEMAFEVRRIAENNDIPIIENIELARSLFARTKPGKEIPEDTYLAVAQIVAALNRESAEAQVSSNKRRI